MYSLALDGISGECLKQDVAVEIASDKVRITYALWEVTLPLNWVRANPVIDQLLNRRIMRSEALGYPEAEPLVTLLGAQGCFAPLAKPSYTLHEVKALFDPLRSQWYADYYAHPAWQRLRSGQASRNGLLTWLIHNYHVSRAAGIVAARMAALGRDAAWARFFRQDTLDEYWHCEAFYSLDTPLLENVNLSQIKAYLPLSSSLAFEEHTLQVAESDPLGHLLIAYFQESSIAFEDESREFYQTVERQYQLQGLFNPWKQHIQIDVDQGHADGLGKLLESDRKVDATELELALSHAWLAFYFLRCGLDDILCHDSGDPLTLRLPQATPHSMSNLQHLLDMYLENAALPGSLSDSERAHLQHGLCESAFRALGFARRHDEIIACGRWAQKLSRALPALDSLPTPSPWCLAVINHMQEAASCSVIWLLLTSLLAERVPAFKLSGEWDAALQRLLDSSDMTSGAAAALFQLDELISRCTTCRDRLPASLLLT